MSHANEDNYEDLGILQTLFHNHQSDHIIMKMTNKMFSIYNMDVSDSFIHYWKAKKGYQDEQSKDSFQDSLAIRKSIDDRDICCHGRMGQQLG